jgi:hypothetical protein
MRNSTVITLVLLVVVVGVVLYIYKLQKQINSNNNMARVVPPQRPFYHKPHHHHHHIHHPVANTTAATVVGLDVIERGGNATHDHDLDHHHKPQALKQVLPLPVSGRFYDSGEFHMVGHLSRSSSRRKKEPATLPLYGQRASMHRVSWHYVVLGNTGQRLAVYSNRDVQDGGCMAIQGCHELETDDLVMVPDLDEHEVWRVKMYSRI